MSLDVLVRSRHVRRRNLLHISLGYAARVLPTNSKYVPAATSPSQRSHRTCTSPPKALGKLNQERPYSFVLDSGRQADASAPKYSFGRFL